MPPPWSGATCWRCRTHTSLPHVGRAHWLARGSRDRVVGSTQRDGRVGVALAVRPDRCACRPVVRCRVPLCSKAVGLVRAAGGAKRTCLAGPARRQPLIRRLRECLRYIENCPKDIWGARTHHTKNALSFLIIEGDVRAYIRQATVQTTGQATR